MKNLCFILPVLMFSLIAKSQDTIVLKTWVRIIATITDTTKAEIKYKKFGQPEPAGIYSVFKSDVLRIHYKDGRKKSYIAPVENNQLRTDRQFMSWRFNFGFGVNYYDRSANDNLLKFWRYCNADDNLSISDKKYCYSYMVNMSSPIGVSKRNMLSSCFEVFVMPKGFINASNNIDTFKNKINLTGWGMLVSFTYGHSINYKKNLFLVIEPGINPGFITGDIKLYGKDYKMSMVSNISGSIAAGLEWMVSKRLVVNFRIGYRFMKADNSFEDDSSSTGYSHFYTNNVDKETMYVNYSGMYCRAGLYFSLYGKQRISSN